MKAKCFLTSFLFSRSYGTGKFMRSRSPFGKHGRLKVKRSPKTGRFCKK
jgi:hypothetical protein